MTSTTRNALWAAMLVVAHGALTANPAYAASCENLKTLKLRQTTFTAVESVPDGPFNPPGIQPPGFKGPGFKRPNRPPFNQRP